LNIDNLVLFLKDRERLQGEVFLSNLEERKLEEVKHSEIIHAPEFKTGADSSTVKKHAKSRFVYETNTAVRKYIDSWIKSNVRGKVVLDLACGSGEITRLSSKYGAKLSIGTDLAALTIENNREQLSRDTEDIFFILDDAENMTLPSNSVDIVICSGMLHHVQLEKTAHEINRVLKSGGKVLAIEALKHNPVLSLYRKLTPNARTHWESAHILGVGDAKLLGSIIPLKQIKYWQMFSIFAIFFPGVTRGLALKVFNQIDSFLLKIPYINRMAWIFTIELEKKN